MDKKRIERRTFVRWGLAGAATALGACDSLADRVLSGARRASPTPACGDGPTPAQTAGPFYTPDTPLRASLLEADTRGTRLHLSGRVLDTACRPLPGALLDFWQADDDGAYDNEGFRLRGHQFADEDGAYRLETVVPGLYPGRTRHIHVKVQGAGTGLLTTQVYFPGEAGNLSDGIFRPDLAVQTLPATGGIRQTAFDFVLAPR